MINSKGKMAALVFGTLTTLAGTTVYSNQGNEQFIVQFKDPANFQSNLNSVQSTGAEIQTVLAPQNAVAVRMNESQRNQISSSGFTVWIEPDHKRELLAQETPYGIPMVQANLISDGFASNQTVCIIDSGYELAHEDLADNSVTGSNDSGTGNWFEDENGHGTHVAGTVAAFNNNLGVVGVAPNGNLNLHIVKVFDADGWAYSSSLIDASNVCAQNGTTVISMSLGGGFKSRTEETAFQTHLDNGILSIAAAGNDGSTQKSYPASYNSVVSVAAIDSTKTVADFSQKNDQVELSAPGVQVLSSVPTSTGSASSLVVDSVSYASEGMVGSVKASTTGTLVDCGLGEAVCADAVGAVCLIQRGNITFAEKAQNCEAGGGVAAIIYNNEPGMVYGTFDGVAVGIPTVGATDTDGAAMLNQLGTQATVTVEASNYAYFNGTSMATPHVSAVAALVWSHHTQCSAKSIREVLKLSAEDLGDAGKDNAYGYGLVQAKAAKDYIDANGCPTVDEGGCKGKNCN